MSAQKITAKQPGHHLLVMGKGNYIPVQTNITKAAEDLLLSASTNQADIVQLATNYL